LGRGLPNRITRANTSDLPNWVGEVDRGAVEESKLSLRRALEKLHPNNLEAQISWLQAVKSRVEHGLDALSPVQTVALTEVLSDLVLNQKSTTRRMSLVEDSY